MAWKTWFDRRKYTVLKTVEVHTRIGPDEINCGNDYESIYQAFKARIMDELYLCNPQPFDCDLMGDVE